jgi:hypothetical protein
MHQKKHLILCLVALIVVTTGACSLKLQKFDVGAPAQVLSTVGAPSVSDGRVRFRQIFCALLEEAPEASPEKPDCESFFWRFGDEKTDDCSGYVLPDHDVGLKIFIVPGAFMECVPELGAPFQKGIERLRGLGYGIETIPVEGRSGSEHNAFMIAEALRQKIGRETDRLLLIGYSKGITDILHFVVNYPDLASQVAAVISVAGAVNGSPLAEMFEDPFEKFFADSLRSRCPPGDKKVVVSLERRVQMAWLASHVLPPHIEYFSLAAFTEREGVARILRNTYDLLAGIDPRNDGLLIFYDQIIPGSTLLGFANTDHWDIAMPVRERFKFLGRPSVLPEFVKFPKDVLLEALVLIAVEQLQQAHR